MAKKFGWNSLYSIDNLLARFLNLFYVIPPVVKQTPVARQRSLMMRFNLPVSRAQRFSGRARDLYEEPASSEPGAGQNGEATFAADQDGELADAESDPARSCQLGSGPGSDESGALAGRRLAAVARGSAGVKASACAERAFAGACRGSVERAVKRHCLRQDSFAGSIIDFAACTCCCCGCRCDCCRKSAREWLLPRVAGSCLSLKAALMSHKRLKVIRDPQNCVLGVLACGYVLSGSGSVKSRVQKRA